MSDRRVARIVGVTSPILPGKELYRVLGVTVGQSAEMRRASRPELLLDPELLQGQLTNCAPPRGLTGGNRVRSSSKLADGPRTSTPQLVRGVHLVASLGAKEHVMARRAREYPRPRRAMAQDNQPKSAPVRGFRIGWFQTRATFKNQWLSYLSIVLLIGLIGGIAMASIAAARRTQSSFSTFIASTNPSDLTIAGFPNGSQAAYSHELTQRIRSFPTVTKVESVVEPFAFPLG